MTPTTQSPSAGIRSANPAQPMSRRRRSGPETPGPTGQQAFACFRIRKLARRLVGNPAHLQHWWDYGGIDELGSRTPAQLLAAGQHEQLEALLLDRIARQRA